MAGDTLANDSFEYSDFGAVRQDIKDEHRRYWNILRAPGSWWTGAERIAIAAETRHAVRCETCMQQKVALSPNAIQSKHLSEPDSPLPDAAIEAVHRIIMDQARVSEAWIDDLGGRGVSDAAYVELVGVVVAVFSIDEFNRGLGAEPEPLPTPDAGDPDHYRPAQAIKDVGFVAMVPPDGATGNEADLWQNGLTANVLRALTLVPDALRNWRDLASAQYLSFAARHDLGQRADRSLNRMQMELIAARVSAINQCFY